MTEQDEKLHRMRALLRDAEELHDWLLAAVLVPAARAPEGLRSAVSGR